MLRGEVPEHDDPTEPDLDQHPAVVGELYIPDARVFALVSS